MIFVFGSNLSGRHGKAAALQALKEYGAEYGVGEGRTGNAYAIPTKDLNLKTREWSDVEKSIETFLRYAVTEGRSELFFLTPIGCGLAGFRASNVWRFLQSKGVPNNVVFSAHWANDHTLVDDND